MKKIILLPVLAILFVFEVLAQPQYGSLGCGMMGWSSPWGGLLGLAYLAIGAFIVSLIFWITYKLLNKDAGKIRKS